MADTTLPYAYVDGATLVPANHNRNLFSTTGTDGLLSNANGNLNEANLVAGFTVRAEHIHPEDAVRARSDGMSVDMDIVSDVFASTASDYVPIAGIAVRFYVPFTSAVLLWQWSSYITAWRYWVDNGLAAGYTPDIFTQAWIRGTPQASTIRAVPPSVHVAQASPAGVLTFEDRGAAWLDQSFAEFDVASGFHDMQLRLYIQAFQLSRTIRRAINGVNVDANHYLKHRVSFGMRGARAIAFAAAG